MSREPQNIGPYFIGEKPFPLTCEFNDADGVDVPMTGYQAGAKIIKPDYSEITGSGVATISNPTTGLVQYAWGATDFTTPGWHTLQLWVGNGAYRPASRLFKFMVMQGTTAPAI